MDRPADNPSAGNVPELRVYPNGPILVRGDVEIVDQEGFPVPRRRRVVALCRCGHSGIAPFCDGTHKLVAGFGKRRRSTKATGAESAP